MPLRSLALALVLLAGGCDSAPPEGRDFTAFLLGPELDRFSGSAVFDASEPCLKVFLDGGARGFLIEQDCAVAPVDLAPGFYQVGPGERFDVTFEELTGARTILYQAVSGRVRIESIAPDRVQGRFLIMAQRANRPNELPIEIRGRFDAGAI